MPCASLLDAVQPDILFSLPSTGHPNLTMAETQDNSRATSTNSRIEDSIDG
jgi:hypothetical protein